MTLSGPIAELLGARLTAAANLNTSQGKKGVPKLRRLVQEKKCLCFKNNAFSAKKSEPDFFQLQEAQISKLVDRLHFKELIVRGVKETNTITKTFAASRMNPNII